MKILFNAFFILIFNEFTVISDKFIQIFESNLCTCGAMESVIMMLLSSAAAVVYSSEHAELSPELNSTDPSVSRETGNNKHTADYPHCIMFSIYNTFCH